MKFSSIALAAATAILSSADRTVADDTMSTRRLRTTKLYTSSSSSSSTQRDVEFGREAIDPYLGLPDTRPRSFHRRAQTIVDGELVVGSLSVPIVNLPAEDLPGFSVPLETTGGPGDNPIQSTTTTVPPIIGGPDENGCIPGQSWCPETQECIAPWEATCSIDGQTFEGGTELVCLEGRCSAPLDDKCLWQDGGAQMGSFYITGLNGPYEVPSTCTLTCTGCEPKVADDSCPFCVDGVANPDLVLDADTGATCDQAKLVTIAPGITPELCSQIQLAEMLCCPSFGPPVIGGPVIGGLDENGCNPSSVWCPETQTCIQTWMETCPIQDGETFEGGTELTCVDGRCSTDEECSYEDGSAQYAGFYFPDLNGPFEVPSNCTLNCTGCEPTESTTTAAPTSSSTSMLGGPDENGCIPGEDWCPETQECIRPWEQTCPIDGETFEGGTELTCVDGRCSAPADDKCLWSNEDNSTQFGAFYLTGLNGTYVVPSTCTLNCTGCEPAVAATTTAATTTAATTAATTTAAPDEASTTTTTEATTFNLNPMPSATPPPTASPTKDMGVNFEPNNQGGAPSSGMMMKSSVVVATFVGVVAGVVALM